MTDDLDKYIIERDKQEPGFARQVDTATRHQKFARLMATQRKSRGLSQTQVAASMATSASIVSRLEAGADVKISTLEKYIAALGMELQLIAE